MVKGGWASSLEEARQMESRDILQALAYEAFLSDYEHTFMEINRNDGR